MQLNLEQQFLVAITDNDPWFLNFERKQNAHLKLYNLMRKMK